MKLSDIKPGDTVKLDGGFTCHDGGLALVHEDSRGLFVFCRDGRHYLDGQEDACGNLVGVFPPSKIQHRTKCRCGGRLVFSVTSEKDVRVTDVSAVPVKVATRLHGARTRCDRCGLPFELKIRSPVYVSMSVDS